MDQPRNINKGDLEIFFEFLINKTIGQSNLIDFNKEFEAFRALKKQAQSVPLLVTEDGKSIYGQNEIVYILTDNYIISNAYAIDLKNRQAMKYFSTFDAAKEWKEENYPRFSHKQMQECWRRAQKSLWDDTFEQYIKSIEA